MKVNDFLFYTLDGDVADPPNTYLGEITAVDPGTGAFNFRHVDTGEEFVFQLPFDVTGPWEGQDGQGAACTLNTHDIYTAAGTDPTPQGVALVTFADDNHYLCSVDSISPTIDVVFYQQPYYRLSFDIDLITQSDWDAYPVGDQILSIEAYVLDTSLTPTEAGRFDDGWWSLARRLPAFPGRIGGAIAPFAVVVHTTDMVPEAWDGLLHRWTTQLGQGNAAHFIIGRDSTTGLVQLAPITSNANHAGGPGAGSFVAGQQSWHPNNVSVGIEVYCAGEVHQVNGAWRLIEKGDPHGAALPDEDVIRDPDHPRQGWHTVTEYQYEQLGALLDGLETVLNPLPAGCIAQASGQVPAWGIFPTGRRVGHVSLNPGRRSDPWPPTCDWLRARG
jgi:N-acetylmuramoyl-L-alanine amidase